MLIQLDSAGEPISQVLKPGLNTIVVQRSASPAQSVVVLAELELLQQHCQGFT